jgi:Flp pilus assembly protein TadG
MITQRGQALVEMAIITPILIFLLIGVFEVGWALRGYLVLAGANREAARFAVRQNYLDFRAEQVGYEKVLSHTYKTLADQLPVDFAGKDTMIISYIEVEATCTGTFTVTTPLGVPTYTWKMPLTSPQTTNLNYTELASVALQEQIKHSCAQQAANLIIRPDGFLTVEFFYKQPQLLGFPLISNPFTDPVPMYTHSTFRKIVEMRGN